MNQAEYWRYNLSTSIPRELQTYAAASNWILLYFRFPSLYPFIFYLLQETLFFPSWMESVSFAVLSIFICLFCALNLFNIVCYISAGHDRDIATAGPPPRVFPISSV